MRKCRRSHFVVESSIEYYFGSMKIVKEILNGAILFESDIYSDERGYFCETFNSSDFHSLTGNKVTWVQDNLSASAKGVVRGLHFQTGRNAQAKLVRVIHGRAFDVIVDLRPDSLTFMQVFSVELTDQNAFQLYVPKGFAHGFMALEQSTLFQYKVDSLYCPESEGGLLWNDKSIGIQWPVLEDAITISGKDLAWPSVDDLELSELWAKD